MPATVLRMATQLDGIVKLKNCPCLFCCAAAPLCLLCTQAARPEFGWAERLNDTVHDRG